MNKPDPISTKTILVLDDEALVAIALADQLEDRGHRVVGPCFTLEEAQDMLGAHDPDLAILDIDIGGTPVWPLARELKTMGCRTMFVSATPDHPELADEFAESRVFDKPASTEALIRHIEEG